MQSSTYQNNKQDYEAGTKLTWGTIGVWEKQIYEKGLKAGSLAESLWPHRLCKGHKARKHACSSLLGEK